MVPINVIQALEESQQQFMRQFDRNSLLFHNGDPTPVPTGGTRVPQSMPTVYDPSALPIVDPEVVKSAEYEELDALKEFFGELKKVLAKICPPLEAVLRFKEKIGFMVGEKAQKKVLDQIAQEKKKLEEILEELSKFVEFIANTEYKDKYAPGLTKIAENARKDYANKEEYMDFGFQVKRFMQYAFTDQKVVIEKLKMLKKTHGVTSTLNEKPVQITVETSGEKSTTTNSSGPANPMGESQEIPSPQKEASTPEKKLEESPQATPNHTEKPTETNTKE